MNEDYIPTFEPVNFVVEATDTERYFLWARNDGLTADKKAVWKEVPIGKIATCGNFHGFPVTVELTWAFINGQKVCFYSSASRVVDYDMVKDFVRKYVATPGASFSNAMNFHNTLNDIDRANKKIRG